LDLDLTERSSARRVEQMQALAREISSEGGSAVVKPLDVTDKAASERIGRELAESGGVQILVNNAGVMPLSPLLEDRVDEWEQMIDVNIKGVLYGIAAALPRMQRQKAGHFINVSSVAGHRQREDRVLPDGPVGLSKGSGGRRCRSRA
jgi:NADP-dependent 3-hydroxy acid dehydrogenase YdfG